MSESAPQPTAGPHCRQCARPFGFAVAFCPFCGASQKVAVPQPVPPSPAPSLGLTAVTSVPPFEPGLFRPGRSFSPSGPSVQEQEPVAPAGTGPERPRKPTGPRPWGRRLVALGVIALIAAMVTVLLRHRQAGTLIVYTTPTVPGAVIIDGKRAGSPGERIQVSPGTHKLSYESDGWTSSGRQVTILANDQHNVTIVLVAVPASIVFDLQTPGAFLRLDDRPLEGSQSEIKVTPGHHRITATRPGFGAFTLDFVLARGERRIIPVMLSPLAVQKVTRTAVVNSWSEPVPLPPRTAFTMAASRRLRVRIGQEVFLIPSGGSINLGDVRGQSLQVKAVDDQPVEVHVYLKPED